MMGILLIFFLGFGFCAHGSSLSSEVSNREFTSRSSFNANNFSNFKRYIMESYIKKYESLLEFHDFVANELCLDSCELLPENPNFNLRISVPQRHLIGEGSHRHLSTTIRFFLQPESSSLTSRNCNAIIIERLPPGVFADPFELEHLLQRGVFNDVAVFGDTNLELPTVLSNRSAVEIHMSILSGCSDDQEITINLPLHARYPRLDESGYSSVKFDAPDLFIHCSIEGKKQRCLSMPTTETADSTAGAVVWRVPSGVRAHSGIVSVVTFLTAFIATFSIALASMFNTNVGIAENFKQS